MKKTWYMIGGIMAMAATAATAQTEVTPYQPGATIEGVTYYLPRTALRIVIVAEKEVFTPGEYCQYANVYLRLKDVKTEPEVTWRLKSVSMSPYGVPDPAKIFHVPLNKKTIAPLVRLTNDGILLAINTDLEETVLPPLPESTQPQKHLNPYDFMDREILSASSHNKIAELTAEEIFEIRESRNALIRGEADNTPKDGAQLQLMLDQLSEQETALTQLFKGTTGISQEVFTVDVVPEEADCIIPLFRFSQKLGVVDADDLSGELISLTLRNMNTVPEPVHDELVVRKKEKLEQGIRYNVPERVTAQIRFRQQDLCNAEYHMGQFGQVEILSNILFDKKTTTKVTFYQTNGAIREVIGE